MGTTLVLLGVLVNVGAVLKHRQTVRRLSANEPILVRSLSLASIVSLLLALLGLAVAIYLILGLGRRPSAMPGLNFMACHWLCQCSSLYTDQGKEFRRALAEPVAHDSEHKP